MPVDIGKLDLTLKGSRAFTALVGATDASFSIKPAGLFASAVVAAVWSLDGQNWRTFDQAPLSASAITITGGGAFSGRIKVNGDRGVEGLAFVGVEVITAGVSDAQNTDVAFVTEKYDS